MRGWKGHRYEHSMASKGIKSKIPTYYMKKRILNYMGLHGKTRQQYIRKRKQVAIEQLNKAIDRAKPLKDDWLSSASLRRLMEKIGLPFHKATATRIKGYSEYSWGFTIRDEDQRKEGHITVRYTGQSTDTNLVWQFWALEELMREGYNRESIVEFENLKIYTPIRSNIK